MWNSPNSNDFPLVILFEKKREASEKDTARSFVTDESCGGEMNNKLQHLFVVSPVLYNLIPFRTTNECRIVNNEKLCSHFSSSAWKGCSARGVEIDHKGQESKDFCALASSSITLGSDFCPSLLLWKSRSGNSPRVFPFCTDLLQTTSELMVIWVHWLSPNTPFEIGDSKRILNFQQVLIGNLSNKVQVTFKIPRTVSDTKELTLDLAYVLMLPDFPTQEHKVFSISQKAVTFTKGIREKEKVLETRMLGKK